MRHTLRTPSPSFSPSGDIMEQALAALVEKRVSAALAETERKENDKLKRTLQENERLREERANLRNQVAALQPGLADEIGKQFMDSIRVGDVFFHKKRECLVVALPGEDDNQPALGEVHVRLKLKKKPKKGQSPWSKQVYYTSVKRLATSTRLRTDIKKDPRKGERTNFTQALSAIW